MSRYWIIPGWGNSGPDHWQSHWERALPGARRIELPDWLEPRRAAWLATLDQAARSLDEPPILLAHSLGCVAVAHWAATTQLPIRGALLVAPPDLDREGCPPALRDFAPVPRARLAFASHVVASDNDPYCALERARQLAQAWGSDLTVVAGAAHLNTDSGHGPWPEGQTLLGQFEQRLARSPAHEPRLTAARRR